MRASCEKWGLEYRIEGVEPFGKWHEHTCYKPVYILQKMRELKRPVVWIDADAEIVRKPVFEFDCDIAVRVCDRYPPGHPCYLYAGTIYLDYNRHTVRFVEEWAGECRRAMEKGRFTVDQQVLGEVLLKGPIRLERLQAGYVAVFDEKMPESERVIVHYQASRLYKKMIDEEVSFDLFQHLSVEELRSLRPLISSSDAE